MKKFDQVYLSIINESKFGSKKWIEKETIKEVKVFENHIHLKERLKERYRVELSTWRRWMIIKTQIINGLIEVNSWSRCSKKDPYQKGFTVHLTISNMWLSGVLQNDLDDKVKRIYFSTFLPEEPTHNPYDIKFDVSL